MDQVQTRLVIPAPAVTRQGTGVIWYEARPGEGRSVTVSAHRSREREEARAEFQSDASGYIAATILDAGLEIRLEATLAQAAYGPRVTGTISGARFELSETDAQGGTPDLGADHKAVLERWASLGGSVQALAEASRRSWGPISCGLYAGAVALTLIPCLEPPVMPGGLACTVAISAYADYAHSCTGDVMGF